MRTSFLLHIALALFLFGGTEARSSSGSPPDTVTLELRWNHQFQFAGYYAAQAKGFYRDAGLYVRIKPEPDASSGIRRVLSGEAEFGIAGDDLLLRRMAGDPVVALAAIFQHSAHAVAVRAETNILKPEDLVGKRLMANLRRDADVRAMLLQQHVNPDSIQTISDRWDLEAFADGKVDAITCYTTTQEFALQRRGIGYRLLHPADYGIDFYGDVLYTSENTLQKNPEQVAAFRQASLLGWRYAMDHQDEIIKLILSDYQSPRLVNTYEGLAFEAAAMQRLILPEIVEIGTMSVSRWQKIEDTFHRLGMGKGNVNPEDFVYSTERTRDLVWIRWATAIIVVALLIVAWFIYWNFALRKQVQRRTNELQQQNALLAKEIESRTVFENALRESEERLRSLVNGLPDLVMFRSADGAWTEANLFARELLGIPGFQEGGLSNLNNTARAFLKREEQELAKAGALTVPDRNEEVILSVHGKPVIMDMIRVPILAPGGERMGVVVIGRDMTKRKRAEDALAEANRTLNAILKASPIAIVAIDKEKNIVQWNVAAESLFGWNAGEVTGKPIPFIPPDRADEYETLTERVVEGSAYVGRILRSVRKDGVVLNLYTSAASLLNAAGETIGAVAMFVDITETLRVQEELRRSLTEKEVLLKEIHHRVKNNLQVISSLLSLQSERIGDTKAKDVFRDSQNRVRSMAMIHERLYRSADLAHVDFGEYVRNLATSLFNSYRTSLPRVGCEIEVDDVQVDVDVAVPCGLILNELVSNALKYAFPEEREGRIDIRLRRVGEGELHLNVADDGVGLPEGFEISGSRSLGYQLVQLLVEQLGGRLDVKSVNGVSASVTFPLTVPRNKENHKAR
ncbi:MAG: ABC transporter substrate-binding protein [Bacteroidota bacterium]